MLVRGDAVGAAGFHGDWHAVLWQDGKTIELSAQVPVNPDHLSFREALAINDAGAIIVKSNNRDRVYLLIPMSEAESSATDQQVSKEADAKKAAFLASVNPLNGSGGKIARASVTIGGMGTVPRRAREVEEAIAGQVPAGTLFRDACESCRKLEAIDDVHAPASYRQHLAAVLSRRALEKAHARLLEAHGGGPH